MKTRLTHSLATSLSIMTLGIAPGVSAQEKALPSTMIVLDASNSMWGQIDGKAKIEIARKAVADFAVSASRKSTLGLVAYGHRRKDDCGDIETVLPLGKVDVKSLPAKLAEITPRGKTPLARAIAHGAAELEAVTGPGTIVVVTDGLETCNADPCKTVKDLAASRKNLTIHVVGFDIRSAEREQLSCIAAAGRGKFMLAANAGDLALAFSTFASTASAQQPLRSSAALRADPPAPVAGGHVSVMWEGVAEPGDVITISLPETPVGGGSAFNYSKQNGKALVTLPDTPGMYALRYLGAKGGVQLGSLDIAVSSPAVYVAAPVTVPGNTPFTVELAGPRNAGDRIGLIDLGVAKDVPVSAAPVGPGATVKLMAPPRSGEFEIRYQTGRGATLAKQRITVAMESITLNVPARVSINRPFAVTWQGPAGAGDQLVLEGAGQPGKPVVSQTIQPGRNVTLQAPLMPGDFEVSYVSASGDVLTKASVQVIEMPFVLQPPAKVAKGKRFAIQFSGPAGPGDMIIYWPVVGAEAAGVTYYNVSAGSPALLVAPAVPGTYEVRYKHGKTGKIIVAAAFVVE